MPNWKNLDPRILAIQAAYDPHNDHAVPYLHSINGFAYNVDMVKARMPNAPVDSLDMLFKPEVVSKFADCGVTFLDSAEDVIQLALKYLGLDPNTTKREDYKAAENLLLKCAPVCPLVRFRRIFECSRESGAVRRDVVVERLCAGACAREGGGGQRESRLLGAAAKARTRISPRCSFPQGAPHPEAAYQFINFILRPDVIAEITNSIYYGNDNIASRPLVESEYPRGSDALSDSRDRGEAVQIRRSDHRDRAHSNAHLDADQDREVVETALNEGRMAVEHNQPKGS